MWPHFAGPGTIEPFGCRTAAAGLWCRAHIEDVQPALFVFAHRCPQCLTQ